MSENSYPEIPSDQFSSLSNFDRVCGIDEQFIENKKEYLSLINDMKCVSQRRLQATRVQTMSNFNLRKLFFCSSPSRNSLHHSKLQGQLRKGE